MGSSQSLKAVSEIIIKNFEENHKIVVSCSAMSQVTNKLIKIGQLAEKWEIKEALVIYKEIVKKHFDTALELGIEKEFKHTSLKIFEDLEGVIRGIGLLHELSDKSHAYLVSFGEKLSTRLLACYLQKQSISATQLDSFFIKLKGDNFKEDNVDYEKTKSAIEKSVLPVLENNSIPIITGFFGTNDAGIISLLGRGGSDFSAAILAKSLNIKVVEIWTDVDGFLSADPRIVKNANLIEEIGYEEASELCFFGAKVLHPKTIRPVIDYGGEVWIKNTFNTTCAGTKITQKAKPSCHAVVSISSKSVVMITLDVFSVPTTKCKSEIFGEIFSTLKKCKVGVDMIASSESLISFCTEKNNIHLDEAVNALKKIGDIKVYEDQKILCIVSPKDVLGKKGVAAAIFQSIADSGVSVGMYSQNASEIAQLVVIKESETNQAIKQVHQDLVEKCTLI